MPTAISLWQSRPTMAYVSRVPLVSALLAASCCLCLRKTVVPKSDTPSLLDELFDVARWEVALSNIQPSLPPKKYMECSTYALVIFSIASAAGIAAEDWGRDDA